MYKEKDKDGELNPEESLYQLFQVSLNNPEAIWQTSKNSWGDVGGEGRERRCTPRAIYSGFGCVGVLQEAIDDFLMSDGKSIHESDLYTEEGIGEDGIPNMYKNQNHASIRISPIPAKHGRKQPNRFISTKVAETTTPKRI